MAVSETTALAGSRVLITGASSGIGLAAAQRFRQQGARVALLAREGEGLRRAAERVDGIALAADVTDRPALERAVGEAVDRLGGIDVLVVNAGAATFGPFRETVPDDFDRVMEVTFTGAVNTIRAALREIERAEGTIVVTTSVAARIPIPLMSAYSAAKHALRGFVRTLRTELRASRSPVRISLVAPGPVDTPFWSHAETTDGRLPPPPPGAYDVEHVAEAIVGGAAKPRSERSVGLAMVGAYALDAIAGPLVERALGVAARLMLSPPRFGAEGTVLHEASGEARESGGLGGPESAALRFDEAREGMTE